MTITPAFERRSSYPRALPYIRRGKSGAPKRPRLSLVFALVRLLVLSFGRGVGCGCGGVMGAAPRRLGRGRRIGGSCGGGWRGRGSSRRIRRSGRGRWSCRCSWIGRSRGWSRTLLRECCSGRASQSCGCNYEINGFHSPLSFRCLGSGLNVPEAKSPVHYGFEMARCRRNVPGLGLVEALSRR